MCILSYNDVHPIIYNMLYHPHHIPFFPWSTISHLADFLKQLAVFIAHGQLLVNLHYLYITTLA